MQGIPKLYKIPKDHQHLINLDNTEESYRDLPRTRPQGKTRYVCASFARSSGEAERRLNHWKLLSWSTKIPCGQCRISARLEGGNKRREREKRKILYEHKVTLWLVWSLSTHFPNIDFHTSWHKKRKTSTVVFSRCFCIAKLDNALV